MNQVDPNIKNERAFRLREVSEFLEKEFLYKMINNKERVLIEERKQGKFFGYTSNYIRVEISVKDYPELSINEVYDVKLEEIGGELKWIVCFAK